jgi:rod shape-determining protein MreC
MLVLVALALLLMARSGNPRLIAMRADLGDFLSPAMETATIPVRGFRNLIANKKALFAAFEENKQLQLENEKLRQWQSVAQALKAENEALRKLAGYAPVTEVEYVTAQVIAQSPDAYTGSLMINAGSAQGLKSLQPVVDSYGLVGRVVEVGERTARVLLLSDSSSHVPVVTVNSRARAILAGTGDELLRMTFIVGDEKQIALGENVMTTAEGGLIPESVVIGNVFRRDTSGVLVKPVRPLARSEYVRVMVTK